MNELACMIVYDNTGETGTKLQRWVGKIDYFYYFLTDSKINQAWIPSLTCLKSRLLNSVTCYKIAEIIGNFANLPR